MDYYKTLGVSKTASQDEIKRAYRSLAKIHHPDRGGNEKQFQQINEAYDTLKDPQKRQDYDNPPRNNFNFIHKTSEVIEFRFNNSFQVDVLKLILIYTDLIKLK